MNSKPSPGILVVSMAMVLVTVWSTSAGAQSTDRNTKEILFSPYLWLTSLSGTSTVASTTDE